MDQYLTGKTIAILVANGFEETEMTEPQRALLKAGATLRTISTESALVNGWMGKGWGHYFPVDKVLSEALGSDFDMLLLPGGERSIAKLQQSAHTRRIVGHFLDAGKPIAAINHGIQLMAVPGKMRGRQVTAMDISKDAVEAAGGTTVDDSVVVDVNTVTARSVEDLPVFIEQMLKLFADAALVSKAA